MAARDTAGVVGCLFGVQPRGDCVDQRQRAGQQAELEPQYGDGRAIPRRDDRAGIWGAVCDVLTIEDDPAGIVHPADYGSAGALFVPRDQTAKEKAAADDKPIEKLEPFKPTYQFWLAILIYMIIFALNQLIRLATPISLRAIEHKEHVAGLVGIAFSLGGLVSAVSVLVLAPRLFRGGAMRKGVVAMIASRRRAISSWDSHPASCCI